MKPGIKSADISEEPNVSKVLLIVVLLLVCKMPKIGLSIVLLPWTLSRMHLL